MRTTLEGILWPPYFQIRLGQYLYLIPITDKSLRKSYFFNLACSICLYHLRHYLKSWLEYHNLRANARPRLEQRFLQYEKHILEKELMFKVVFHDDDWRLERYFCNGAIEEPKPTLRYPTLTSGELLSSQVMIEAMGPLGPFRLIGDNLLNVEMTNLTPNDKWNMIYDGDIIRLREHKGTGRLSFIYKAKRRWFSIADERQKKRFVADLYKAYRSYHRYRKARPSR